MGWTSWNSVLLVLVLFHDCGCFGCFEKEGIALLELKAYFSFSESSVLPSWEDGNGDCCQWEGVKCNRTTQRVVELFLNNTNLMDDLTLNASMFAPFEELKSLNLSSNIFTGLADDDDGFKRLSKLNKLELLDLSNNTLDNTILASLSLLSSLKTLSLGTNVLDGSTDVQELACLNNLEELDLSNNLLESFITIHGLQNLSKLGVLNLSMNNFSVSTLQSLGLGELPSLKKLYLSESNLEGSIAVKELKSLKNLEVLDLSINNLSNSNILQIVQLMTSLKALSLRKNGLNSTPQVQGLCKLKNLQELDLSDNGFEGPLPTCLETLTFLRALDLSKNQFSGNISSSLISRLTLLEFLSLSHNPFQSVPSFSSFANHSKLEVFELVSGNKALLVETEYPTWVPKFQLKIFRLSNCTLKKGSIPSFLYYQNDLRIIDLSYNNLEGDFPTWLMENNTRLEVLHLKANSFASYFHLPSRPNAYTTIIDISNNHLHGPIPSNISICLPNLMFLNASKNSFEGRIPSSFGDVKNLVFLDLSNNSLSGGIPESLALGCSSLEVLRLSNNDLQGQMLPKVSNLTILKYLYLDGNHFTGKIPDSLSNSLELVSLDISFNSISGELPGWIGNMTSLDGLFMTGNHLEGPIPVEFCSLQALTVLDLSKNNLSGSVPSFCGSILLTHVHLQQNGLTGQIGKAFSECSGLVTLDLTNNHLTGSIPNWVSGLSSLSVLSLRQNHFEGKIPLQLCQLSKLMMLDLSYNNLSGSIPSCLNKIPFKIGFRSGKFFITSYFSDSSQVLSWYSYQSRYIEMSEKPTGSYPVRNDKAMVEFTTKNRSDHYNGNFLYLMTGIDFSSNNLMGRIPPEIGELHRIRALNLSRNRLTGPIPTSFSGLKNIESLDLSYNNLTGTIPPQITELYWLAVFKVSHNNLSGKIPDGKAQFGTFQEDSYEGNMFLCGQPLKKNCTAGEGSKNEDKGEKGFIDMFHFYVSFAGSYIAVLLGLAAILYINPDWRRKWFGFVDVCVKFCCSFVQH